MFGAQSSLAASRWRLFGHTESPEQALDNACASALEQLEDLIADTEQCPLFLPRCKAVVICTSTKAGLGLALQHGRGVMLCRLPNTAGASAGALPPAGNSSQLPSSPADTPALKSSNSMGSTGSPRSALDTTALGSPHGGAASQAPARTTSGQHGWSAPCFVSLTGLSAGITVGAQRSTYVIGVMSEAALQRIQAGGTLALGAEWSLCLLHSDSNLSTLAPASDLCAATLARGLMVDINLQSVLVRVDEARNRRIYGADVRAADLTGGEVPLPAAAGALVRRLSHAEGIMLVTAFEPSHAGSEAIHC